MADNLSIQEEGGAWFIVEAIDYEDAEGYAGCRYEYRGNQFGYPSEAAAIATLEAYERTGEFTA